MSNNNIEQQKPRIIRCTLCRVEIPENEIPQDASCCPQCGSKGLPQFVDHDVDIRINWHDLRVLCIWAKNWEDQMISRGQYDDPSVIDAISRQISKYRPSDAASLSIFGELQELAETLGTKVEYHKDGETLEIEPKKNLH